MKRRAIRPGALPVRQVLPHPNDEFRPDEWPATIPAVTQLLREGLELPAVTVLVGENGSGKSTIIEGIAGAYGMSPEGGSTGARHSTRPSESSLQENLRLVRGIGGSRWGFFFRAETMHGFYSYLELNPRPGAEPERFHEVSHGESFLSMVHSRFRDPGLYILDEPESALSFAGCLALVGWLNDLVSEGNSQVLLSTHSPVLAALPGARILQLDDEGYHESSWKDLELVQHYRSFLAEPMRYLRHVI